MTGSTITGAGDIVLHMPRDGLGGKWRGDLGDALAEFDADRFPDDVEPDERVYFAVSNGLYAFATVREVADDTVRTSGALRLRHVTESPVDVDEGEAARIDENGTPPQADWNVSSDTVVDTEAHR